MKSTRIIALLFAAAFLSTGCVRSYFPGPSSESGSGMTVIDYDVTSGNWRELNGMFEAVLSVPQITSHIVSDGNVQVSRRYPGENNGADILTPLPAIRTEVVEAEGGGDYYFTTFIDYEWSKGTISIYVTTSDLYTGDRPGDMYFRVFINE